MKEKEPQESLKAEILGLKCQISEIKSSVKNLKPETSLKKNGLFNYFFIGKVVLTLILMVNGHFIPLKEELLLPLVQQVSQQKSK